MVAHPMRFPAPFAAQEKKGHGRSRSQDRVPFISAHAYPQAQYLLISEVHCVRYGERVELTYVYVLFHCLHLRITAENGGPTWESQRFSPEDRQCIKNHQLSWWFDGEPLKAVLKDSATFGMGLWDH